MQPRLLIAARDVELRAGLARVLRRAGYALELAEGRNRINDVIAGGNVALAILEPNGFGSIGLELARGLRASIASLIVIAKRPQDIRQYEDMDLAADAYVSEPIDPESVLERVIELLGKSATQQPSRTVAKSLVFEGYALDLAGRSLRNPSGQDVSITPAQFTVLAMLAARPGQVLSRDQISEAVAGRKVTPFDRSVDVLISRIRRKIESDPKTPRFIITVPGCGYKFAVRPQVAVIPEVGSETIAVKAGPERASPSIGLVPFNSMEADQDCHRFAQYLTEDTIAAVLQTGFMVSSVSVDNIQNESDLRRAAKEFRIGYLLLGSVRRSSNGIRVTARLTDPETGRHLWAERYDIPTIEPRGHDAISEKIAASVSGLLRKSEPDRVWPRQIECRPLTIVTCEYVGIARLAGLDPEDLRVLILSFHRCCTEVVARFGGQITQFDGDAMMACFGFPLAHEDDAERAVRAGLALVGEVGLLGATPAGLRVGIATGPVIVGDLTGLGTLEDGAIIGESRNLAIELRRKAQPNSIVIDASTRRLIRDLFECRKLDSGDVEKLEDGNIPWEILRPSSVDSRFEALYGSVPNPMIGREDELDLLLRHWRHVQQSGEMRVVQISGEPGIGKSRLTAALQDCFHSELHTCIRFFCSPYHQDSTLYPVIRQLEGAARFERDDLAEIKVAKLNVLLGPHPLSKHVLPLLTELLGLPAGMSSGAVNLTPREKREILLEALLHYVENRSREGPVLVIFEDAHWSDATSRELLDVLIDRLTQRPVLLLITFRPEFLSPWTGRAYVTTLTLSRLRRPDSIGLIRRVTRERLLPKHVIDEIVDRTDGVPLFLEELTQAVLEADRDRPESAVPNQHFSIPATLHSSLLARLDRLDLATKEVAQIGAAIGREFSYELITAVSSQAEGETAKALDSLVSSGLAFGRGAPPHTIFLFKHGLVRDAAYSTLPRRKRQQVHSRIAYQLQNCMPEMAERLPEVVAYHCTEAGLTNEAIAFWSKAARKSIAQSAMAEAAVQLRKGLELLATLPSDARRLRQELELQSALGTALVAAVGHGSPEVGEVYARAAALAERLDESEALVPILGGKFSFHLQRGDYDTGREIARNLLYLASKHSHLAARVVGNRAMGVCMHQAGAFESAAKHFEEVLELYVPDKHQSIAAVAGFDPRATALRYLAFGQLIRGHADQASARIDEMMSWSRMLGRPYIMVHALNWSASFHILLGNRAAALKLSEELFAIAEPRFPLWLALGQINRGLLLAMGSDPAEGVALGRRGLNAMIGIGSTWNQSYYRGMLAQIHAAAGQPIEAIDELKTALSIVEKTGENWFEAELNRLLGELLLSHSASIPDAEAKFQRAIAVAKQQNARMWELRAATSLSRLWESQGKKAEAKDLLAPLYRWFAAGPHLPDLQAASAILLQSDNERDPMQISSRSACASDR